MSQSEVQTNRVGPILQDGTRLWDLIDFERREVALRVMNDPEIYRMEQRKVFAKSWFGIGHANEIPDVGDFVKRYIGEDQVVVTRARDGEVHVLLNACSHRGMEICWADQGNQASFKCPYHGWVFDHAGNLMGAPFEKEMYGDWDKSQYGLRKAQVEVRHGIIFANFDLGGPSLSEWLGDMNFYVDAMYEGSEDFVPVGPPIRFQFKGNWKTLGDQNAGDLYHIAGAHQAILDLGYMPNILNQLDVVKVGFPGKGHNVFGLNPMKANPDGGWRAPESDEEKYGFANRNFSHLIFPITTGGGGRSVTAPDGSTYRTSSLNHYMPKGMDALEVWQAQYVDKRAPEAVKRQMNAQRVLTIALLQDDADACQSIQKSSGGAVAQELMMKYNAVLGETKPNNWPGPGTVYAGFCKDDTQWDFWRRWFEMMAAEPA